MGAAVTLLQANQLPEVIERDYFQTLTNNKFKPDSYDAFADHNGKVSRERMLEIASTTDCYLSHEWGIDSAGRNTSNRVRKISQYLQSKELFTSFDEGQINGKNSYDMIKERIQKAQCIIICMTERYFYQLKLNDDNPTKIEFYEAMNKKDLRYIIPIVMEKPAFHIPNIITSNYPQFMHKTHLNFTEYNDIGYNNEHILSDLYLYVTRCINPLCQGGFFKTQYNQFLLTIQGRHYKWLINNILILGHNNCMKYANIFQTNNIESTTRLYQYIQHNENYLESINIPIKHAILIKKALKSDLNSNFDTINIKLIDQKIEKQNIINNNEIIKIKERNQIAIDMKIKYTELINMSIEDNYSRNLNEYYNLQNINNIYNKKRNNLLNIIKKQSNNYNEIINNLNIIKKEDEYNNIIKNRRDLYIEISKILDPVVACGYKLFIKVDIATKGLLPEHIMLNNNSDNNIDGSNNDITTNATTITNYNSNNNSSSCSKNNNSYDTISNINNIHEKTETKINNSIENNLENIEIIKIKERNQELLYLLQESVYICYIIKKLSQNNIDNIIQFIESGIVKLLMALLNQIYLFNYSFDAYFLPMEFHYLNMPIENILAIKYLIKNNIGRRNINNKLIYLFIEAGLIELCIEILRFHIDNINIITNTIDILYILLNNPEISEQYVGIKIFLNDINNFILLIIILERYSAEFSEIILSLHSSIIGIIINIGKTGMYDSILYTYRGDLFIPILNTILTLLNNNTTNTTTTNIETTIKLCDSIKDIYFTPEYQNSHYFTSDFVPKNESFLSKIKKKLNYRIILRYVKNLLVLHHTKSSSSSSSSSSSNINNDIIIYIHSIIALGNISFQNEKIQLEVFRMKIHENIMKILKFGMKLLENHTTTTTNNNTTSGNNSTNNNDAGSSNNINQSIESNNTNTTTDTTTNTNIDIINIRELIYEIFITITNIIIIPKFLTYDTKNPENNITIEELTQKEHYKNPNPTITSAINTNINFLSSEIQHNNKNNTFLYFLNQGICEIIMNILTNYHQDRVLVRNILILLHKLIYRGRYEGSVRLIRLGLAEQVWLI